MYYTTASGQTWTRGATYTIDIRVKRPNPPLPDLFVERVMNAAAWLELNLPIGSKDAVKAARKRLAMTHHPDRGGSVETMQQINAAADFLLGLT